MNKKIIFFVFALTFFLSNSQAQVAIKSTLFGQNAWYINVFNTNVNVFSAGFDARLSDIAASGVEYIRIGGIDANFFPLYSWNVGAFTITSNTQVERLTHLIDVIRAAGMKPIVEVGFNPLLNYYDGITCSDVSTLNNVSQTNQATIAGNLVDYFNNSSTGIYKLDPIVYWIIANEPDLSKNCNPHRGLDLGAQTSATTIASYVQEFATKMKDKDPTIKIIGSELASFGNDNGSSGGTYYNPSNKIMDDLINNPVNASSIMGQITTGNGINKYFIDVISFHYYPNLSVRADVISNPSNLQNGFKGNITDDNINGNQWKSIVEMISDNSTGRTLSGSTAIGIACNEFNLENAETSFDESTGAGYSNMIKGVGSRSYLGGQWMAEVLCYAMNSDWVEFMNPWSAQEGDCTDGKGYISGCGNNNAKRPAYWHYQMVANNFTGTYLPNVSTAGGQTNYKAFAYQTATEVGVLIINQSTQSPRGSDNTTEGFTINFNGTTPATGPMKFSFSTAGTYTGGAYTGCAIQKESTMFLKFNNSGAITYNEVYTLQDALRGASDVGPNTWVGGTFPTISTQALYTAYSPTNNTNVYGDINIIPITLNPITAATSNVFQFTNSAKIDGAAAAFSSGTKTLCITAADQTCH